MNISCFRDDVEPPRGRTPSGGQGEGGPNEEDVKTDEVSPSLTDESPKLQPMAFSIEFNEGKTVDLAKYESFMKRSQARHQRVQSMSASWQRPSPASQQQQRPPMSAKLPRKAHGYHSEGYFSSDQEDTAIGASKIRTTQEKKLNHTSPGDPYRNKHLRLDNSFSPTAEKKNPFEPPPDYLNSSFNKKSKTPIVDSIMSRSDILPSRQGLNLPLKHPHTTSTLNRTNSEMISSPGYLQNCPLRSPYFIEPSPNDVPLLADTSSPELDLLTPDNAQMTPSTPMRNSMRRNSSGHFRSLSPGPRLLSKTSPVSLEQITRSPSVTRNIPVKTKREIENEGNASPSSTISEAGTYTIEADNYTEEQKAMMNIDEIFGVDDFKEPIMEALGKLRQQDTPQKPTRDYVITKEPRFASGIREELLLAKNIPDPIRKVSTDKNVLEISCCYESPTESHEPPQIVKTPKTAKSYLDKIKNRVKNISEKTFQKQRSHDAAADFGSFTSVTASGILSSNQKRVDECALREKLSRKNSLTKSQIDAAEYVHHMPVRDNLVVQAVSNESFVPSKGNISTVISNDSYVPPKTTRTPSDDDDGCKVPVKSPEQILVSKLSHISLNRCQGDKSWIQEWADSVKKYNREGIMAAKPDLALTGLPPVSPRHSVALKGISSPVRSVSSACSTPSKIPSPIGTLIRQRPPIPDILSSTPDTESYLASTQNVITNLQAKLHKAKAEDRPATTPAGDYTVQILPDRCNNYTTLSRSNSLNYRLRRNNNNNEGSPLRNPGAYCVTGARPLARLQATGASRSFDAADPAANRPDVVAGRTEPGGSPLLKSHHHARHGSFDGRSARDLIETLHAVLGDYRNANMMTRSLTADRGCDGGEGEAGIDQTVAPRPASPGNRVLTCLRGGGGTNHRRSDSDSRQVGNKRLAAVVQGSPIRRSSSFNVVNKCPTNNNNIGECRPVKARNPIHASVQLRHGRTNTPELDVASEDSDNLSTGGFYSDYDRRGGRTFRADGEPISGTRYNRAFALRRARLESPDARPSNPQLNQHVPVNSPRCPGTPEMRRKFSSTTVTADSGGGGGRRPRAQSTSRRRVETDVTKGRNPATSKDHQTSANRLTRSSSTAKDLQPKYNADKSSKKAFGNNNNSSVSNVRDVELQNWKKRSTYDPMKAAQEGKRRTSNGQRSSASQGKESITQHQHNAQFHNSDVGQSSPVHRSRSFNCCAEAMAENSSLTECHHNMDAASSDTEDDHPSNVGISGSVGDTETLSCGNVTCSQESSARSRQKQAQNTNVSLSTEYVTKFQINQNSDTAKRPSTCGPESLRRRMANDLLSAEGRRRRTGSAAADGSDTPTTATTNGSGSDIEDWEPEVKPAQVPMREKSRSVPPQQRHSGDFSVSSSATSASRDQGGGGGNGGKKGSGGGGGVQPRYMDISKYKTVSESSPAKTFLRRDPSKTYVAVLPSQDHRQQVRRNNARQEQEMKIKELEKWKRRASYDPRKAVAQAKVKPSNKSPSGSVLRSQSFHGPMLQSNKLTTGLMERSLGESYYQDPSSDNEF